VRTLVMVNTTSGGGDAGVYEYIRTLGASSAEVVLRYFEGVGSLGELLADATSFQRVVAVGGDGTVSAICYALRNTGVPILCYPGGTANLLALNLGVHLDARYLAETTVSGVPVDFDLGEIARRDDDGTEVRSGFTIMMGAGYDASIIEAAQPMKSTLGAAAYLFGAVGNFAPTIAQFEIELDGWKVEADGIAVLVVNFGRLQFDIEVARGADPRDGMFDIAVLRSKNVAEMLPTVVAGLFDRAGNRNAIPGIDVYSASRVSVSAEPPLRMQYDGDVVDATTPFTATVLRGATTLLLPQDSPYALEAR
jgi:diacylglycerol kinase family enzyme